MQTFPSVLMSDLGSKDSHLSAHAETHDLFLQYISVDQRNFSILLFSHQETHCYYQVIIPQLKGILSLSTISPQNPVVINIS